MLEWINGWLRGLVIGAVVVLSTAITARANTLSITFNGAPTTNPTLTIQDSVAGFGPVTGYIDPYKGTTGTQSVLLFCVDPYQDAPPVGTTWSANVAMPGNTNSMSNTFQVLNRTLSDSSANLLYEEMARLAVMLEAPSNTTLMDQEIQAAIWQLADPNLTFPSPPSGFSLAQVTGYENAAKAAPLTSGFEVLTDTNDKYQEYIVLTPEPSTFLMLVTGLIGLLYIVSRRKAPSNFKAA
jgi:hypothetical protein